MNRVLMVGAAVLLVAGGAGRVCAAQSRQDLLREVIRQQSSAERSLCGGIKRTLEAGNGADLVVKTAIELGYAACPVIRCAIEAGADLGKVVRGASESGMSPEVVSRCAIEAGVEPGLLGSLLFEDPLFCYLGPEGGPAFALPASQPGGAQQYDQPEFSRFQP